jgi:hypothetical protein
VTSYVRRKDVSPEYAAETAAASSLFHPGHQVMLLYEQVDKLTSLGETPQEDDVMTLEAQI